MKKKLFFPFLVILLLAPWPVAYAYDDASAGRGTVQVEAAAPSATPSWIAFGGAIGGVTTPADLFYIDTTDEPIDILATLHLTNAEELVEHYRYLTLKVGVYVQTGANQWEPAASGNDGVIPETYLTMHNGRVSFILPSYARYKVTIDSGCFYCYQVSTDGSGISPKFYLSVENSSHQPPLSQEEK